MIYNKTTYPSRSGGYSYTIKNFLNGISVGEYDDGMLAPSTAVSSYNFDFSGGKLKSGVGFKDSILELFDQDVHEKIKQDLASVGSIIKTFIYRNYNQDRDEREDKLLLLSEDLNLFILNLKGGNREFIRERNIVFTSVPNAISYRLDGEDVLIFTSLTDNMVVYDGKNQPYEVLDAPKVSSMDLHFERLFVTTSDERSRIVFSDDLDPTMWSIDLSEAGFIEMVDERGALGRVISFGDYLYIFRDYGISRLTAFGDQEGFSLAHLFVSSAKIFPESVSVCGDRILFLASNGLYSFDGFSTTKILDNLAVCIDRNNSKSIGAFFEGKYYLACNLKFEADDCFDESEFVNNTLLVYDIRTKKYKIIRGVDTISITPAIVGGYEKLYICARDSKDKKYCVVTIDDSGTFCGNPLEKVWKTGFYSFGENKPQKCMRSVSVECKNGGNIKVISDSGESKIIDLIDGMHKYNFFVFGSKFSFEFRSRNFNCEIFNPEITFFVGGGY